MRNQCVIQTTEVEQKQTSSQNTCYKSMPIVDLSSAYIDDKYVHIMITDVLGIRLEHSRNVLNNFEFLDKGSFVI